MPWWGGGEGMILQIIITIVILAALAAVVSWENREGGHEKDKVDGNDRLNELREQAEAL